MPEHGNNLRHLPHIGLASSHITCLALVSVAEALSLQKRKEEAPLLKNVRILELQHKKRA